jgi:hypothetical protein
MISKIRLGPNLGQELDGRLLTVVWIGSVFATTWQKIPTTLPPDWARDPICAATPEAFPSPSREFDPDELLRLADNYLACERRELLKSAAIFAIPPPILVLGLGAALIWAFRGFRHQ